MAVFFPTNRAFGPWAFNTAIIGVAAPAPSEAYYYPAKAIRDALGERDWGFRATDGSYTDGPLMDAFQKMTTDMDFSTGVLEKDDDTLSPYKGEMRVKYDCV